jgi:molecular chaperone DnaJ
VSATDYYEVLGVARGASAATIKLAYRQLVLKYHPDVSEDKAAAEQKLREINESYTVLSDHVKRANYDRFGHAAAGTEQIARVFDMFFGTPRGAAGPSTGKDLRFDADVTAEELVRGTTREIAFPGVVACEACQGSGAEPGTPVSPCGRCSASGVIRQVQRTTRSVHLTQTTCSVCNGEGQIVSAPCRVCDGRGATESKRAVTVTIPAGSDHGSTIRIEGGGEPGLRGGPNGDLYLRVTVTGDGLIRREPQMHIDGGGNTLNEPVTPAPVPSSPRLLLIVVLALCALVTSAAILYATHRNAAVASSAGGTIAVCATPSMERLAADLVRGYTAKTVNAPNPQFITRADWSACDSVFSFAPGKPEAAVARDAIVVVVNRLNAISRISEPQLRGVFTGSIHDWSELGGPRGVITPFEPDAASDEAPAIDSWLFGGLTIDRGVIRRPSSADVTRAVAGADQVSRGAIGLVTFSQAVPAKMIPLAYLPPPNVLTIASRRYPLTLTVTLQSVSQRDLAATRQLVDFARSPDGAAIVEKNGLIPPKGF